MLPQVPPSSWIAPLVLVTSEGKTRQGPLRCLYSLYSAKLNVCACVNVCVNLNTSCQIAWDKTSTSIGKIVSSMSPPSCPQSSNQDIEALTRMSLSFAQQAPVLDSTAAVYIHSIYQFTSFHCVETIKPPMACVRTIVLKNCTKAVAV